MFKFDEELANRIHVKTVHYYSIDIDFCAQALHQMLIYRHDFCSNIGDKVLNDIMFEFFFFNFQFILKSPLYFLFDFVEVTF